MCNKVYQKPTAVLNNLDIPLIVDKKHLGCQYWAKTQSPCCALCGSGFWERAIYLRANVPSLYS